MSIKIGVPRGLYFYKHYPFTKAFLTELGAEIIASPETNKEILDIGSRFCIDDACLPVKVYHGHAGYLKDKVDYLLIPRLTSIYKKEYICPKFGGLPEMIKFSLTGLPPIIDTEINIYKHNANLYKSLYTLGFKFTKNTLCIKKAINKAVKAHLSYEANLFNGSTPAILIDKKAAYGTCNNHIIGIIAHPYLLHDSFVNMNLLEKLSDKNIRFITPEMVDSKVIESFGQKLEKRMFWSSGKNLIGSALYMMQNNKIEGLLILTSFACGIDSLTIELIHKIANRTYKKPIMTITLDEHTGEANFNTRLEAFLDLTKKMTLSC